MRLTQRALALVLSFSLLSSGGVAHELPDLGEVSGEALPFSLERKIGQQIMHDIRWRDPSYLDDPDVEAYLNQLGARLVAVSEEPGLGFEFFTVNDPSINAFAMPGGFIGVHVGLILSAQTESELAGVLAHEIAHVTQRHIARQVFRSKQLSMASMLAVGLALLAARSNSNTAGAVMATSEAGAISAQLAFSRDFERESDRAGFELLERAGFDVRGMSGFFARLQKSVRLYENNATVYLRTHPLSGERLSDMQNREQLVAYRQIPDSDDFHLVRARLRARQGLPEEAKRDFEQLIQARKFAHEAAAWFGLADALKRARQWSEAAQYNAKARALVASPILEHQAADLSLAMGKTEQALSRYQTALQRYPNHKGLMYGEVQALLQVGRFVPALSRAETYLHQMPNDVPLLRFRAEAFAGQGRKSMQHWALAEAMTQMGQLQPAIEQLLQAQKAGDGNFYEMSMIDARQRELKKRHLEELREKRN